MGEARERRKFQVIQGGKSPERKGPPERKVRHQQDINMSDHDALERERANLGVNSAESFDLILIGTGLGCVQTKGYMDLYKIYADQIEEMRKVGKEIPPPTMYGFAKYVTAAGVQHLLARIKESVAKRERDDKRVKIYGEHEVPPPPPEGA